MIKQQNSCHALDDIFLVVTKILVMQTSTETSLLFVSDRIVSDDVCDLRGPEEPLGPVIDILDTYLNHQSGSDLDVHINPN